VALWFQIALWKEVIMQFALAEAMRYRDFLLAVRSERGGRFFGQVLASPAGETGEFPLRFSADPGEIEEALASVTYTAGNYLKRSNPSGAYDPILNLGERLFQELMRETVIGRMFRQSQEKLESRYDGLRLRIVAQDAGVLNLPWEFLFDPAQSNFLALSLLTPLIRQVVGAPASPILPTTSPLRVLVVTAEVLDFEASDEIAMLQQLQEATGLLDVRVLEHATYDAFVEALQGEPVQVVHFISTGAYGSSRGRWSKVKPTDGSNSAQGLLFMGSTPRRKDLLENAEFVPARELAELFQRQAEVRFVFFNACDTDQVAAEVTRVVPAALGIRAKALNPTCQALARGFYEALVAGQPLESAVTAGRQMVDRLHPGSREWGLPTFYLNAPDGALLAPLGKGLSLAASAVLEGAVAQSVGRDAVAASPVADRQRRRLQTELDLEASNLKSLRAQEATLGEATPKFIRSQIDELEKKVEELQKQLEQLPA
jgi:hypothetical protein